MDTSNDYVVVIGGVNIDIVGYPYSKLIPQDSNIGGVKLSLGGVGRNIAENLARLDINTKLISILGDDIYGKKILDEAKKIGIDTSPCRIIKDGSTSTYLAILDENQDMSVAISSMDIYDKMTLDQIDENKELIKNSKICLLDTNIPEKILKYLLENFKETDFYLDTVSTAKAVKIKENLGEIHTLKTNRLESTALTDIEIKDEDDLIKNWNHLKSKGLNQVFITLGEEGVFFADKYTRGIYKAENIHPENTTGAGDAFTAALAYCSINKMDIYESAKIATGASIIALAHKETINPEMSPEKITEKLKEVKICMKNI
ncbi:MAG: PfkB family carbohydrate kinase [Bacillota bacterium]|nr:PfkB family carbohydrate kinase [Bacillota bacterium]